MNTRKIPFLWLTLTILFTLSARAVDKKSENQLVALANSESWKALLHFSTFDGKSRLEPDIFFLSNQGHINPLIELKVFLQKLSEDFQNTACTYPARFQWLKQNLPNPNWPEPNCTKLNRWLDSFNVNSLHITYAGPYMGNPASVFGHTFLRLENADLLNSTVIDYAGQIAPSISATDYLRGGLMGDFYGLYTIQPFYSKLWEYNYIEGRDIWDFELKFDSKQIRTILLHLWELKRSHSKYYFLTENCSLNLLNLLKVAEPSLPVDDYFDKEVIPFETIRILNDQQYVSNIQYIPSKKRKLKSDIEALSKEGKELFRKIIQGGFTWPNQTDLSIMQKQQTYVQYLAVNYIDYQMHSRKIPKQEADTLIGRLNKILVKSENTSESPSQMIQEKPPKNIFDAHLPHRIALYHERQNSGSTLLNYRYGIHSLSDVSTLFSNGNEIELFSLSVRNDEQSTRLSDFTLIKIQSLNPTSEFFPSLSWNMSLNRTRTMVFDQLTNRLSFHFGKSYQNHLGLSFALFGAEYNNTFGEYELVPSINLGHSAQWNEFNFYFNSVKSFSRKFDDDFLRIKAGGSYLLNPNQALNIEAYREKTGSLSETQISIAHHWYF